MTEILEYELTGAVAWLTFNRPDAMNAFNAEMGAAFMDAMERVHGDPSVRAVVLTGEGRSFCAGGDVGAFHEHVEDAPPYLRRLLLNLHGGMHIMFELDAPVISAVNGVVAGAGMGLCLATDLSIAAESAKFTMAYTGIGASPDGSSTFFLPRAVGLRRAMELTLTNRVLTSAQALEWGLVNEVVADETLRDRVGQLAERLASGPTLAYGRSRRLLRGSLHTDPATQLELEGQGIVAMGATEDFREGVTAFATKRKPTFKGA